MVPRMNQRLQGGYFQNNQTHCLNNKQKKELKINFFLPVFSNQQRKRILTRTIKSSQRQPAFISSNLMFKYSEIQIYVDLSRDCENAFVIMQWGSLYPGSAPYTCGNFGRAADSFVIGTSLSRVPYISLGFFS